MRKVNSTTRLNRAALDAIRGGFVDSMSDIGARVVEIAKPNIPDAEPFGQGLVTTGDWAVWSDGKKVAGTGAKPKRAIVKQAIVLIVEWGFPGRFQVFGTVNMPSNDFATQPMLEVLPDAARYIKPRMDSRLRGVR
jgi:hypothetical protein